MIKIENIVVDGFEAAIRGMRNPMNSWERSDSRWSDAYGYDPDPFYRIGSNDHDLMMRLVKGGPVHAKFRRFITVSMDITAPLYWWKEFDTYKVGTACNSCSTMHKIHAKEFTIDDFSCEHLEDFNLEEEDQLYNVADGTFCHWMQRMIEQLNVARSIYLKTKDKRYWWQMIQLLPSSYNQRRTVLMNYETLANIYQWRKDHKLDEWREFCKTIEQLPYSEVVTGIVD